MKGTIKIIAMLLVVMTLVMVSTQVFATESDTKVETKFDSTSIIQKIEDNSKTTGKGTDDLAKTAGKIISLIRNIAVIAGVILLSVLGIKYMLGSAEEKADYKKSLIPLVVGIVVVMAASQIISMIFGFFN